MTGWRRAFCTSVPKEKNHTKQDNIDNTSKTTSKFGFFSNPSTPRLQSQPLSSPNLRCRTTAVGVATSTLSLPNSPKLQCKTDINAVPSTTNTKKNGPSPRSFFSFSTPSSPKSPSSFSMLKVSLGLTKISSCGICLQSVKTGQGTALFTAECSHSFHFPCIASIANQHQLLACPVCSTPWREMPWMSFSLQDVKNHNCEPEVKLPEVKTKSLRVYNDDEPLMSPISRAAFNSIPELDENEDAEEDNEFQGFFVSGSPVSFKTTDPIVGNVEIKLLPEIAVVAVRRSYQTYAVVMKVKAPQYPSANKARRPPVDLVTVIDVSGSNFRVIKRAMRLLLASMQETDRLSIVAFSASSKRLLPLRRMTANGRRSARRIVDAIGSAGQGMSMNDAIKKAAKVLEDRREKNPTANIVVLSDGGDNANYTTHTRSSPFVSTTRFSNMEIPVHTVRFGGSGGAYTHAPVEDAFTKCIGSLLSVVVQDLKLQLGFVSGSSTCEISSVYPITGRSTSFNSGSVTIGDLYGEEERELLIELKVPASTIGSHNIISVRSSYVDPSSQELINSKQRALLVPRPQAVRSSSPGIGRLRNLHISTLAMAESRRLIDRNDFSGARHLLSSARALLLQSNSSSADEFLHGLETELAEIQRRQQSEVVVSRCNRVEEKQEPLTPTSAWKAAERLAKVAIMRKHLNRVSDLHGFENARF